MAKVHIYVRSQAQVSSADADAIAGLFAQAQTIVEAAGGEWTGSVSVQSEPAPEPTVVVVDVNGRDLAEAIAKPKTKRRW
jgi:hypothetical protein